MDLCVFVMPCFLSIKVERKANFLLDIISLRASAATAVVKKAKKRRGFFSFVTGFPKSARDTRVEAGAKDCY